MTRTTTDAAGRPIPRAGLGGGGLGNLYRAMDDDQAHRLLTAAWDAGIRHFDTAPHYGLGLSERRVGAFLRTKPRDEFIVSTKVGRVLEPNPDFAGGDDLANGFAVPDDLVRVFDPSADGVRRSLDASLERLGLDRVDTVYLHDPDAYDLDRGIAEGLPALVDLRAEGVVRFVGIGTNDQDAATRAVAESDLDLVMIAGRYTLLEQPAARDLLPLCLERGVGVVAVGVFNSGLLASPAPAENAHYNYAEAPEALVRRAQALAAECAAFGVELPAAAIQFALRHPAVESVVLGASSARQIQDNVARLNTPIPEALWTALAAQGGLS